MRDMYCDVCGKKCTGLTDLVSEYQTEEVKEVCHDCLAVLNKELDKIRKATRKIHFGWIKNIINNLRMVKP